jgi:hypothetical protein
MAIYGLIAEGEGWSEVGEIAPAEQDQYEAVRFDCMDPRCPLHWPGTLGMHSHIAELGQ